MKQDSELDTLREYPRFTALLEQIEAEVAAAQKATGAEPRQ
jgi:hypothetical protein